jgi:hypothetical protein
MIFAHTHTWITGASPHTGRAKTQTRRLVPPYTTCQFLMNGGSAFRPVGILPTGATVLAVYKYKGDGQYRLAYEVGRTYAVQPGRGKPAVARFRLKRIRLERLQEIGLADAQAEGCRDVAHFRGLWTEIHGDGENSWEANPPVFVLEMEV